MYVIMFGSSTKFELHLCIVNHIWLTAAICNVYRLLTLQRGKVQYLTGKAKETSWINSVYKKKTR